MVLSKTIILIYSLSTIMLLNSCSDNPINDVVNNGPGRRDYIWEEDTLKLPSGYGLSIGRNWGSSPNNIWLIGAASSVKHGIWHYDGESWKTDSIFRPVYPGAIYGFSRDNVWIGNNWDGSTWHYNGVDWSKFSDIDIPGYRPFVYAGMWGSAPNNIYAVGLADRLDLQDYKGVITHFNGSNWELVNIPDIPTVFIGILYEKESGKYLIASVSHGDIVKPYRLYVFDGQQLTEIFSSNNEGITVYEMNGNAYVIIGRKIYKYANNNLRLWKDFTGTQFVVGIFGRNEEDFFTLNWDGIGHYNGTDLKTIYPSDLLLRSATIFSNEVFFYSQDENNSNIIIRGTLK